MGIRSRFTRTSPVSGYAVPGTNLSAAWRAISVRRSATCPCASPPPGRSGGKLWTWDHQPRSGGHRAGTRPGLDHDLTHGPDRRHPTSHHHFGAAESAECQPPRGGSFVPIGRGPELDQLERLPHSHGASVAVLFPRCLDGGRHVDRDIHSRTVSGYEFVLRGHRVGLVCGQVTGPRTSSAASLKVMAVPAAHWIAKRMAPRALRAWARTVSIRRRSWLLSGSAISAR